MPDSPSGPARPAAVQSPAGDTAIPDLLGGAPRPATRRFNLPRDPTARTWRAFVDWIDAELADGVPGGALRADNDHALRLLRAADPDLYDAVQERLTANG